MPIDLVEIAEVLEHPAARIWAVLTDFPAYPKFVREISWCEHVGHARDGNRLRMRLSADGSAVAHNDIEILVRRPLEHLVLVSPQWPGGHASVRLAPLGANRTEVRLELALPDVLTASMLRKAAHRTLSLIDHHLSGLAVTVAGSRTDQAVTTQSQLSVAKVLTSAGVLTPGRPDKVIRQLRALSRWGATVAGGYRAAAARYPRRRAITDELGSLTFGEMDERTTRLANGLTQFGIQPGHRVALMCRNHGGMIESITACGKLGVSVVLLNTGLSANQVVDAVRTHRPAALMTDEEFLPLFAKLTPTLPRILTWGTGTPSVEQIMEQSPAKVLKPPDSPGKLIVLTSGTTSNPKGARRRNPHGLRTAAAVLSRIPLRAGERMMIACPLFHTWGLAAMQLASPLHAEIVLQPRFDAEATLRVIQERCCTSLIAVPIMLQRILALPRDVIRRYDTSSLRVVASSGSPLSRQLVQDFLDTFGDVLYNLYGSTEVSWASIATPADLRAAPTTAGRCPVGTRVGILDDDGNPVPPGTVGRICVGNDMLFEGYTSGEGNTVYGDLMVTGDLGYLDAGGRLFVSGRDDDMIISGGENVFPRPVEDLLQSHPDVLDAAVVGVLDRDYGQRFVAFVVRRPGAALNPDEVRGYVHANLPRFAVPRDVTFVNSLPRNATGKLLRRMLLGG